MIKRDLYICLTVYHLYISAIKASKSEVKPDLVLMKSIDENVEKLKNRIEESDLFSNVIIVNDDKGYIFDYIQRMIFRKKSDMMFGFIKQYSNLYFFNDLNCLANYCNIKNIKYHLIEDGLDSFRVFDQRLLYNLIYYKKPLKKKSRLLLTRILGIPTYFGQSEMCIDIEVNSGLDLATPIEKPVKVVPRDGLVAELNCAEKKRIMIIFPLPSLESLNEGVLVLTTPNVAAQGLIPSGIRQVDVIKRMIEIFSGYRCFIKPHPHDQADYKELSSIATIIEKNIPVEVFDFYPDLHMHAAITYSSSSIGNLSFCSHKYICRSDFKYSGVEFIDLFHANQR